MISDDFPVGGLEAEFYFSIQLGISSSQLTLFFFRGVGSTTNQFQYQRISLGIPGSASLDKAIPTATVMPSSSLGTSGETRWVRMKNGGV